VAAARVPLLPFLDDGDAGVFRSYLVRVSRHPGTEKFYFSRGVHTQEMSFVVTEARSPGRLLKMSSAWACTVLACFDDGRNDTAKYEIRRDVAARNGDTS
jgi:hypothetical protein